MDLVAVLLILYVLSRLMGWALAGVLILIDYIDRIANVDTRRTVRYEKDVLMAKRREVAAKNAEE